MAKPMTAFTTDLQHSGMIAKDLDETIKFYREVMGFELAGLFMNGENRCAFLRIYGPNGETIEFCQIVEE